MQIIARALTAEHLNHTTDLGDLAGTIIGISQTIDLVTIIVAGPNGPEGRALDDEALVEISDDPIETAAAQTV